MRIKTGGYAFFLRSHDDAPLLSPRVDKEFDPDKPRSFSASFLCGADGMMYVIIAPYAKSPTSHKTSFGKSSWIVPYTGEMDCSDFPGCRLVGSLVQKDGHVYSLAAFGDSLYTGSDSRKIRVWKDFEELSRFKSNSGLVKTIVISGGSIFTGHQDGKIRIWTKLENVHKRVGSLPTWKDKMKRSVNPKSYIRVRHRRKALPIRHIDAVSCLSPDEEAGLMYSGSWDNTVKVWRLADSRCMESVNAHDDAVNTVLAMGKGVVLTGSAEGKVKAWRRESHDRDTTRHVLVNVLLSQESAITSLAVNSTSDVAYCGSSDGVVNFWTVTKGRETRHAGMLWGHGMAVLCLSTGGSRMVFSGSVDKSVRVWRREMEGSGLVHTWLGTLTGHTGPIKCLAVTEEGDERWRVYSGSLDGSVRVWSMSENQPTVGT